jgi:hypothetical protein
VSVRGSFYARAGFSLVPTPPLSGIYYTSVALYNALTPAFSVQNGTDQTTLSSQTAQLFAVPTSGSNTQLTPEPAGAPYGAYLGPLEAVWYEPDDQVGSFPVTLGALAGLIQWTPQVTIDTSDPIYVAPGSACYAIALVGNSDPTQVITVKGVQSGKIIGQSSAPGSTSLLVLLESGTGDTIFAITASAPITTVLSLSVGAAPSVNAAQTVGSQQVLLGTATAADPPPSAIIINTNPLWRSIWVLQIGNAMPAEPPVCQGASGAFYQASTPPYLIPIPGEQLFYRFNIIPAAEDEVTLSLVTTGALLFYWGADFADTDVLAYDQSGGGGVGSANSPDPLRFSYAGDLDASLAIPGGAVSCPPGATAFITRLWAWILAGTSVDVTVRVNSYPAYSGPVDVSGLTAITITTTPDGFVLPTPLQVFDLDIVDIVLSSLVGTPAGLGAMADTLIVP